MKARSDVMWLVGILILLATTMQVMRTQRAETEAAMAFPAAARPAAAFPPPSLWGAGTDESTMWIPVSNIPSKTAAMMVTAQFRDVTVRCYGPHLMRVQAAPATVHRVSTFCRRLDQPSDRTAWCDTPQE